MTVHYTQGCPWANGEIQCRDTDQTDNWDKVTCKKCLANKETGWNAEEFWKKKNDEFDFPYSINV